MSLSAIGKSALSIISTLVCSKFTITTFDNHPTEFITKKLSNEVKV